jgi:hypothetical protein
MSQYLEFYVKVDDNKFVLLDCFSRSSYMYGLFQAPYGKAQPVHESDLTIAIENANEHIAELDEQIAQRQTELTLMWNGEGSFDVKHDFSVELQNEISQLAAEKRDYIDVRAQVKAYKSIWRYACTHDLNGDKPETKAPLYFGVECELFEH